MKYDLSRAVRRNVDFMTDRSKSGILVWCCNFGPVELPPVEPLETFDFPKEIYKLCDQIIENGMRFTDAHAELDDDWLPAFKPRLGIAEHSCFLGGKVTFGANTSYHFPAIDDIGAWRTLTPQKEHPHYKMLLDGMAYMSEKAKEYGFFTAFRGTDGPIDIANAVRGNDILYDFVDEPEEVDKFLAFCADAAAWNIENQRPFVSNIEGGTISGMGTWMPGNAIGHLSEDASCLISPAMYRNLGLKHFKNLVERYDYAFLHVHSLGRACIPMFAAIDKIGTFQISGDPNQPDAIDVYKEYADALTGKTVQLSMTAEQVRENIGFLRGRRTVIDVSTADIDEAKEIIDLVRE